MKKEERRVCKFCHWWVDFNLPPSCYGTDKGECRLNAPSLGERRFKNSAFPVTNYNDWCGEFYFKEATDE